MTATVASESAAVYIARCPEHGLHGQRETCFDCGAVCDQVAFVPARRQAAANVLEELNAERDHWERRYERYRALEVGGRRDDPEESIYADGVRAGFDLALMILREDETFLGMTHAESGVPEGWRAA